MSKPIDFPIKHIEDNIFASRDGSLWAYFVTAGFGYDFKDTPQKKVPFQNQMNFLTKNEHDLHYLLIPQQMSGTDVIDRTIAATEQKKYPLRDNGLKYLHNLKRELENGGVNQKSMNYHGYIGIQLKMNKNRYSEGHVGTLAIKNIKELLRGMNNPVRRAVGLDPYDILKSDLKPWQDQAESLQAELSAAFSSPVKPLSKQQSLFLTEYSFLMEQEKSAGEDLELAEEVVGTDKNGEPVEAIRPHKNVYYDLQNVELEEERKSVRMRKYIDEKPVEQHVKMLVVDKMSNEYDHPGFEWIYDLQTDLNFPIAVSIRACYLSNKKIRKELDDAMLDYNDQKKEAAKGKTDVSQSVQKSEAGAINMESEFQKSGDPAYACSFVLRVTGKTKQEMENRVEDVRRELNRKDIKTQSPYGEAYRYFMEFVPGGRRESEDYWMKVSPGILASMMFGATTRIGDNRGNLIGFTKKQKKHVFLQADLAAKNFAGVQNKFDSLSMVIVGETGKGKSLFMNMYASTSALTLGSQVLIIDPKGDRKNWVNGLPFIEPEHISVWELGKLEEDAGSLDPFRTSSSIREGKDLCINILSFLLEARLGDPRFTYLSEAVEVAGKHSDPCVQIVIDTLSANLEQPPEPMDDEERRILKQLVRSLKMMQKNGLASLLFGKPNQNYRVLSVDKQIQVLMVQNLELPEPGENNDYPTISEKISESILLSVTAFTKQFILNGDAKQHKIILQDEAKIIEQSKMGAALLDWIVTKGRYYNTTLLKGTQNATDVKNANNLGMKVSFLLSQEKEAETMLKYCNLPVTPYNVSILQNLHRGECLLQDIYGRAAIVNINAIFPEFLEAFRTDTATDEELKYEAEHKALEV